MPEKKYDIVIIGSGPGGYVAGIRASQLGLSTVVVEKDKPGGVCLNIGCIPSKSLIHQASVYRSAGELSKMGIGIDTAGFDYGYVQKQSRMAAEQLSKGVQHLLKKNNVEFIQAEAKILPDKGVQLSTGSVLSTKNIIIATGAESINIPDFPVDEKDILSSTGALFLTELPKSMMILGAGAIGIEFAYIFHSFGVEIHVVEMLDRILPLEDYEISTQLEKILEADGIRMRTGTKAVSYEKIKNSYKVHLQTKDGTEDTISVEKMLIAVGRAPNIGRLGLEQSSIQTEKRWIKVNDYYQTSVPGIYAIGDVLDSPQLAHVASKEGEIAVEHIAERQTEKRIDPDLIPRAVYCEPQTAGFGPTEHALNENNIEYKKATFPYKGAGKATAINKSKGFVKLLYTPDYKEIISAYILGAEASELIHEILLAKKAELLPEDIARMIHVHPTLSETVMEVMRGAEGWMIHA